MQEGVCDRAADEDDGASYEEATRALVRFRYKPDDNDMSDVAEAAAVKEGFESGHVHVGDLLGNPHGKGVGRVTKEVVGDVYLSAGRLLGMDQSSGMMTWMRHWGRAKSRIQWCWEMT